MYMLEKFERIKLGHFPTPIEHLKNITKYLDGPNIFIKRDDCTGLATGGNKTNGSSVCFNGIKMSYHFGPEA